MDKKSFIALSLGPNVIKHFFSVIYEFSYWDRVFVRLGCKGLKGINTLAYYEIV